MVLVSRMFADVEAHDPRADNARHNLTDILVIAILGVMCGCDDFPGIHEYARDEAAWLRGFLSLPHGVPSPSRFRRLFAALRPRVLEGVARRWAEELAGTLSGKLVVLDGKTLCASPSGCCGGRQA